MKIALAEVGYREGEGNTNKYAAYLDSLPGFYNGKKNGYAWCDIFVDYCFVQAYGRELSQRLLCQPNGSAGAGCTYSARYYQQAGRWSGIPQVGAQVFFGTGDNSYHTGLVCEVDENKVYTIEGNAADRVAKREYFKNSADIYGYGIPDYSIAEEGAKVIIAAGEGGKTLCTAELPELQFGDVGEAVRAMQELLRLRGQDLGSWGADGEFGKDTAAALTQYQRAQKLSADGVCGRQTWARLIGG